MLKLLRANFSRLWKTRAFWAAAAVSAMAGAGIPIKYFLDNRAEGSTLTPNTACFACAVLAPILLSVLIPLFLGSDYSDGTLRNKRVAGHTRGRIYLANLITCAAAGAMLCAAYLACYLALALPLLGGFDAPPEAVLGFAVLTVEANIFIPNRFLMELLIFLKPSWFGTVSSNHVATSAVNEPEKYDAKENFGNSARFRFSICETVERGKRSRYSVIRAKRMTITPTDKTESRMFKSSRRLGFGLRRRSAGSALSSAVGASTASVFSGFASGSAGLRGAK